MLRSILALLAYVCLISPGSAGGHPQSPWTGCYAGAHFGRVWGDTHWSDSLRDFGSFVNNQIVDFSHAGYGGLAGCNLGVEADLVRLASTR
jgi:hypothetical protein